jgi:hypothetical protein
LLYRDRLIRDQIRLELPGTKPCESQFPFLDIGIF